MNIKSSLNLKKIYAINYKRFTHLIYSLIINLLLRKIEHKYYSIHLLNTYFRLDNNFWNIFSTVKVG